MAIFKKGNNWYIDYYVQGRRKREKIGPNKAQARVVLQKRKVEIAEGKFLDVKKSHGVRFKDMANTYLESYAKPNKKSFWRDEISLRHLKNTFRGRYLDDISSLDVEDYKARRLQAVSPATVNRELACLKHMFNEAVEWGKVNENPTAKVKLLREENRRIRYLEKEETEALSGACSEHLRPIVITALNTGMRKSEILNLKWSEVDLLLGKIYLYNTKNGKPRDIDINEWLAETLLKVPKHPESPYVFCNDAGKRYGNVRKSFETAKKKAGIEDLRFHDLRHNFASQLAMAGVGTQILQEILGHSDYRMTQRYTHVSPGHKKAAMELFCKLMDTIWTPKLKKEDPSEETNRVESHQLDTVDHNAEVAQSVEHWTENPGVDGSIPSLGTLPT